MRPTIRGSTIPLLAVLLACSAPRVDPSGATASDSVVAAVREAVARANANYEAGMLRGDAAAIASGYAADAVVMRPRNTDLVGRPAIEAELVKEFAASKDTVLAVQISTQTLDVAGGLAWEYGVGSITARPKASPAAQPSTTHWKYLTFWRRDPDGVWRATRDMGVADSVPTP